MDTKKGRKAQTDNAREGTDIPHPGDDSSKVHASELSAPNQSHMGAADGQVKPTIPATQALAELTSKKGQAQAPEEGDYNPRDEVTPG